MAKQEPRHQVRAAPLRGVAQDSRLRARTGRSGLRQNHGVDDVNDPIRSHHVSHHDLRAVYEHLAAFDRNIHALTLYGARGIKTHDIGRQHLARYDMVGKHIGECLRVRKQSVQRRGGQFGKRFIRWRKHGERPLAFQRLDETGSLHRSDERVKVPVRDCNVDNVRGVRGVGALLRMISLGRVSVFRVSAGERAERNDNKREAEQSNQFFQETSPWLVGE